MTDWRAYVTERSVPEPNTGCWIWLKTMNRDGYGLANNRRAVSRLAPRVSYAAFVGPIPSDLQIDHLCRNRWCVNPAHLEPVTLKENVLRGHGHTAKNKAKTHCIRGHEFTPENIYHRPKGGSPDKRECHRCRLDNVRQWARENAERINAKRRERRTKRAA